MIAIIFLSCLIVAGGSIVFYSLRYGISPMPSSKKAKNAMLTLIPKITHGKIIELGSGWGTLAFPLAEKFPNCEVDAYEISLIPWAISYFIQLFKREKNLRILRQDFFNVSLNEATIIVCYLYPGAMRRLKNKFEVELLKGTFVVSQTFAIPGWIPLETYRLNDIYQTPVYLYQI